MCPWELLIFNLVLHTMIHIDILCLYWLLDIIFNKPLHVMFLVCTMFFNQYREFIYLHVSESVCPTLLLLDLVRYFVKQSAAQLSVPASDRADISKSVSTKLTSTVSPPSVWLCYHVTFWEHFSYAVCCIWHSSLFTPFPLATFFLVLLTYSALQFLDGGFEPGLCSSEQCTNRSLFKWARH